MRPPASTGSYEVNRSTGMNQGKTNIEQSGAVTGKKDPSILKPSGQVSTEKESSGGTIGIISKPKIEPKVDNYMPPKNVQP